MDPVLALVAVLLLIVIRRQHLDVLMQAASLLGVVLVLIWLQNNGYLTADGQRPARDPAAVPGAAGR